MSSAQEPAISAKWDASQIPSQSGKIAIVTGANSGIGYVTARELARKGAHVVLACRTVSKGEDAAKKIREEISSTDHKDAVGQVEFMQLDVSSLASVQTFAGNFKTKFDRLDVLINNAGIMGVPFTLSVDGYESQFATNHLGHFALTAQLFDRLKSSGASRVVNLSSNLHTSAKLDPEVIVITKDKYSASTSYGDSKLCNLLFTYELERRLKAAGISDVLSVAAHPGTTQTNIMEETARNGNWITRSLIGLAMHMPFIQDVDMGALPTLYAATAPNVRSGEYFGPNGFNNMSGYPTRNVSSKESHSETLAATLWSLSEKMAKMVFKIE